MARDASSTIIDAGVLKCSSATFRHEGKELL